MIYRKLGRTGFEVSAVGLGGLQFTGMFNVSPEEADAIIDYAFEHGVNIIDTAQGYGFGESEAIIGRALLRNKGRYDPYVCCKFGHFKELISRLKGDEAYVDYNEIMRCIKHTMWVMRIDHFKLLMYHETEREWKCNFDTGDCVAQDVLEDLKKEGITEAIGTSSWDSNVLAKVAKTGRVDVVLAAGGIHLLSREGVKELIPACKSEDVGLIVGGCLGQNNPGLVRKDYALAESMIASGDELKAANGKKLKELYALSDELGIDMIEMAVRYVLSFEDIHSDVIGAREVAHIKSNIESAEKGALSTDVVERINAIQDGGLSVQGRQVIEVLN